MKMITLQLIVTASWLCSCCFSQNMEQLLYASLTEAIGEIKALSQSVTDMKNGLELLQDSQKDANEKISEIKGGMELIQGQLEQMQGSSWPDDSVIQSFVEILKLEFHRMEESIQVSGEQQISNLTMLLATDECAEGSHSCSLNALCEDAIIDHRCRCLPGYIGDGFTCEDVNECSTGDNRCHDQARCENSIGNYSCACNNGYLGDGLSCEDIDECSAGDDRCHDHAHCENSIGNYSCVCNNGYFGDGFSCEALCKSPSKRIRGLGCIIPVKEQLNWQDAKENCRQQNARLIEGITTQDQLDDLKAAFNDFLPRDDVWLGIFRWNWMMTQQPIEPSSLWRADEPDKGHDECGYVLLYAGRPSLGDNECTNAAPSLCQKEPPSLLLY